MTKSNPVQYTNRVRLTFPFRECGCATVITIQNMILRPKDSRDEWLVVLTGQPRISSVGQSFLETPAGQNADAINFRGVAAKEMEEEAGLCLPETELIDTTELALGGSLHKVKSSLQSAMYPSPAVPANT